MATNLRCSRDSAPVAFVLSGLYSCPVFGNRFCIHGVIGFARPCCEAERQVFSAEGGSCTLGYNWVVKVSKSRLRVDIRARHVNSDDVSTMNDELYQIAMQNISSLLLIIVMMCWQR